MTVRTLGSKVPEIGSGVYVDPSAQVIGKVNIGDESSIWPCVVARGDVNLISIGRRTNIQDGTILHVTHPGPQAPEGFPLIIGDDVTVGHQAMLHACTIGNRVLIGMQAVVLDGAVIPDEVIIGAGSLVPPGKKLESGFLYLGSPVKKARELSEDEIKYFTYSAKHYIALKNEYLADEVVYD